MIITTIGMMEAIGAKIEYHHQVLGGMFLRGFGVQSLTACQE
jgi:hypothetical protein